jgi:hypothetical protein
MKVSVHVCGGVEVKSVVELRNSRVGRRMRGGSGRANDDVAKCFEIALTIA